MHWIIENQLLTGSFIGPTFRQMKSRARAIDIPDEIKSKGNSNQVSLTVVIISNCCECGAAHRLGPRQPIRPEHVLAGGRAADNGRPGQVLAAAAVSGSI